MISVLILTKNEEDNLPACLASVNWSDDVHVLDSHSADGTVPIARSAGAHVHFRDFDSFAAQQNWALRNIPFRHPWVFYLDADERVTPALKESMLQAAAAPGPCVAFRVQRRDFFMDTWLKHVQLSPYFLRLFRPEKMQYERLGHPVSVPDGPVGQVQGYLDHYPFSKGIAEWIAKHNFYSTQEAQQILLNRQSGAECSLKKAFFARDFHERRRHQKEIFYRIPARPLFKFAMTYLGRRGFLDGRAGLAYSLLQAFYEYMIVIKTEELSRTQDRSARRADARQN
jgi:glycosyltransferase involved in cell wall biosynthesis